MGELPNGFESLLPRHKASLHLTHNEHKDYYETIEQWMSNFDWEDDWVSAEQRELALENQEIWVLQWYPITPISFYRIMGYSLEAVLDRAKEIERDQGDRKR